LDSIRFGAVLKRLSGAAAECIATDNWTAWRSSGQERSERPEAIRDWLARGDVVFVQGNAFEGRTPVALAAIESVARFKARAMGLAPVHDSWHKLSDNEMKQVRRLPPAELDDVLLQTALDWRQQWRGLADAIGVGSLPELRIPDGEPQVLMIVEWPDPKVRIEWGDRAQVTRLTQAPEPTWGYEPLSRFLAPGADARIYREVVDRTEKALGCSLGSQAWNRPERVAAWAW
jgi:hypothetical protein